MLAIKVVPYDPAWPSHFERIKGELEQILAPVPYLSIQHVGSTSVPGLAAKPVIDIDIVVTPEWFPSAAGRLGKNGHTYNPENTGMDRLSFRYDAHAHDPGASKPTEDGDIRRQVYLVMPISKQFTGHILVRHVLRKDAALREEYAKHKLELAQREHESIGMYGYAKNEVLAKVRRQADEDPEAQAELERIKAGDQR